MPVIGLGKETAISCVSDSNTKRLHVYCSTKVTKLSHGQPPTEKTRTLMAKPRISSIGACTIVVARVYENGRYMPLRISSITERISMVMPMSCHRRQEVQVKCLLQHGVES